MIYVIVGFRVNEPNSVYYGKATTIEGCQKKVAKAFEKGAQFISLRGIKST